MGLLTRDQRQNLITLLLSVPNMSNAGARQLLLDGLPDGLKNSISSDPAPAVAVANIVDAATSAAWATLPDGTLALETVINNAIFMVQGSRLALQLQTILDSAKTQATEASPAPATPITPDRRTLMTLNGPQRQQLYKALLTAFPTFDDFNRLVDAGLGVRPATIYGGSNLGSGVLALITWAESRGKLTDLVQAALDDNPTADLVTLATPFGLTPAG